VFQNSSSSGVRVVSEPSAVTCRVPDSTGIHSRNGNAARISASRRRASPLLVMKRTQIGSPHCGSAPLAPLPSGDDTVVVITIKPTRKRSTNPRELVMDWLPDQSNDWVIIL
jgi:hypothetical protein